MISVAPRHRLNDNSELKPYPGLGRYRDGRYFYQNPHTGRQTTLKTRDKEKAIVLWAIAKAATDRAYGDMAATDLADKLQASNTPISKGANIHLCDFIKDWREKVLEAGLLKVKIKRGQGKPVTDRTKADYIAQAKQLESSDGARFPLASPKALQLIRALLSPWGAKPTHYNHLKAVLGRVYDHAVFLGLIDKSPMRDIDKLPVEERTVLIPDQAYIAITDQLMVHRINKQEFDGEWRVKICDLSYMLSQQPVDLFSLRIPQLNLKAGDHGRITLARHKTGIAGEIDMNADMREVIDWLLEFRRSELAKRSVVGIQDADDHLLIYPAYLDKRSRWKPVKHRTFSAWWLEAREAAGITENYRLMDLRSKGLTDEEHNQGANEKGLHATQRMKDHYVKVKPPKRSTSTLTAIRERKH